MWCSCVAKPCNHWSFARICLFFLDWGVFIHTALYIAAELGLRFRWVGKSFCGFRLSVCTYWYLPLNSQKVIPSKNPSNLENFVSNRLTHQRSKCDFHRTSNIRTKWGPSVQRYCSVIIYPVQVAPAHETHPIYFWRLLGANNCVPYVGSNYGRFLGSVFLQMHRSTLYWGTLYWGTLYWIWGVRKAVRTFVRVKSWRQEKSTRLIIQTPASRFGTLWRALCQLSMLKSEWVANHVVPTKNLTRALFSVEGAHDCASKSMCVCVCVCVSSLKFVMFEPT